MNWLWNRLYWLYQWFFEWSDMMCVYIYMCVCLIGKILQSSSLIFNSFKSLYESLVITIFVLPKMACQVSWGCRIHWLHLCRGVRPTPNECPGYDTKQSDGEVPVMLELWGMQSTSLLPSLPGPLWPGVVAPDRAQSMDQIELICVLLLNWIVWIRTVWLNWRAWNRNVFDI